MKPTMFILALTVTVAVVGCSNSGSNPVSSNDALTSGVTSTGAIGTDDKGVRGDRVEGTIVAIDLAAGSVTIRTQGGSDVEAITNAATKIERNGFRTTLSSFQIGDRGQARFSPGTLLATKIEAVGV